MVPRRLTAVSDRAVTALVMFCMVASVACERSEVPVELVSPPDLELVSAGNEPRMQLRYRLPAGLHQKLELSISVRLTADEMGGPMPSLVLTLDYAVDAIMPTGQMALSATIESVTARDTEGSNIPAAAISGALEPLSGLRIYSVLGPDGRLTATRVDPAGKQLAPELSGQLTSLVTSFQSTMMTLPLEPVGAGAVWRNSRPVEQNGLVLKAVNSVSLAAIKGDVIDYVIDSTIHGPDQTVTQEGTAITVKDIVGDGSGKGTLDLTKLLVTSNLYAELRSTMQAPGDDEPTLMKMATILLVKPL
jgi:hypothetical protein